MRQLWKGKEVVLDFFFSLIDRPSSQQATGIGTGKDGWRTCFYTCDFWVVSSLIGYVVENAMENPKTPTLIKLKGIFE